MRIQVEYTATYTRGKPVTVAKGYVITHSFDYTVQLAALEYLRNEIKSQIEVESGYEVYVSFDCIIDIHNSSGINTYRKNEIEIFKHDYAIFVSQ